MATKLVSESFNVDSIHVGDLLNERRRIELAVVGHRPKFAKSLQGAIRKITLWDSLGLIRRAIYSRQVGTKAQPAGDYLKVARQALESSNEVEVDDAEKTILRTPVQVDVRSVEITFGQVLNELPERK